MYFSQFPAYKSSDNQQHFPYFLEQRPGPLFPSATFLPRPLNGTCLKSGPAFISQINVLESIMVRLFFVCKNYNVSQPASSCSQRIREKKCTTYIRHPGHLPLEKSYPLKGKMATNTTITLAAFFSRVSWFFLKRGEEITCCIAGKRKLRCDN